MQPRFATSQHLGVLGNLRTCNTWHADTNLVLMVDDEMCLFLSAAERQNVRFDGLRGSFHTGVQCS